MVEEKELKKRSNKEQNIRHTIILINERGTGQTRQLIDDLCDLKVAEARRELLNDIMVKIIIEEHRRQGYDDIPSYNDFCCTLDGNDFVKSLMKNYKVDESDLIRLFNEKLKELEGLK